MLPVENKTITKYLTSVGDPMAIERMIIASMNTYATHRRVEMNKPIELTYNNKTMTVLGFRETTIRGISFQIEMLVDPGDHAHTHPVMARVETPAGVVGFANECKDSDNQLVYGTLDSDTHFHIARLLMQIGDSIRGIDRIYPTPKELKLGSTIYRHEHTMNSPISVAIPYRVIAQFPVKLITGEIGYGYPQPVDTIVMNPLTGAMKEIFSGHDTSYMSGEKFIEVMTEYFLSDPTARRPAHQFEDDPELDKLFEFLHKNQTIHSTEE